MFEKPSLILQIAIVKGVGFLFGPAGLFLLPFILFEVKKRKPA